MPESRVIEFVSRLGHESVHCVHSALTEALTPVRVRLVAYWLNGVMNWVVREVSYWLRGTLRGSELMLCTGRSKCR